MNYLNKIDFKINKNSNSFVMNIYDPAQDLEILGASTITSENIRIFDHLLEHVIHVAPHLATAVLDEAT